MRYWDLSASSHNLGGESLQKMCQYPKDNCTFPIIWELQS